MKADSQAVCRCVASVEPWACKWRDARLSPYQSRVRPKAGHCGLAAP